MVLGRPAVPGRPTNLDDNNRARTYCAWVGAGGGLFGHFFSLLSPPLCIERQTPCFICSKKYHNLEKVRIFLTMKGAVCFSNLEKYVFTCVHLYPT